MRRTLFNLGPLEFHSYTTLLCLSFVLGTALTFCRNYRNEFASVCLSLFIVCLAILMVGVNAFAQEKAPSNGADEGEAEALRIKALAWADSFHTFEGAYGAVRTDTKGSVRQQSFFARFRGSDLWVRDEMIENTGENRGNINPGDVFTMARLAGDTRYLLEDNKGKKIVELNRSGPLYLSYEFWARTAVGLDRETGFRDIMQGEGTSLITVRDGQRILSYWCIAPAPSVDIFFDGQDRVTRIDYVARPDCSPEDARAYTKADLFDIRGMLTTVELEDYQHFGDVDFPCRITYIFWRTVNHKDKEVFILRNIRHEISDCETCVQCMLVGRSVDVSRTTVVFDPATIRINQPLSDDAFRLDIPKDAVVIDKETHIITEPPVPWWRRHSDTVVYVGALTLFALASLVGWRYWRGRA